MTPRVNISTSGSTKFHENDTPCVRYDIPAYEGKRFHEKWTYDRPTRRVSTSGSFFHMVFWNRISLIWSTTLADLPPADALPSHDDLTNVAATKKCSRCRTAPVQLTLTNHSRSQPTPMQLSPRKIHCRPIPMQLPPRTIRAAD